MLLIWSSQNCEILKFGPKFPSLSAGRGLEVVFFWGGAILIRCFTKGNKEFIASLWT